mgnify:CR=1 FL=1
MRNPLLILAAVALLASLSAFAQNTSSFRYKWYDGQGLVHFSDSLTSEAMKYGYELVNDRGLVVQHVSRQLSVELQRHFLLRAFRLSPIRQKAIARLYANGRLDQHLSILRRMLKERMQQMVQLELIPYNFLKPQISKHL